MAKLRKGDALTITLGVNMPVDQGDRGSPWVRAEVSSTTTVGTDESYTSARKRLHIEAAKRLDLAINRVYKYVVKGK